MQPDSPPELGNCLRVVDEENEFICNEPGVTEILVRNKFGLFSVAICEECFHEHRTFYAELRSRTKDRTEHGQRASQTRGRIRDNAHTR